LRTTGQCRRGCRGVLAGAAAVVNRGGAQMEASEVIAGGDAGDFAVVRHVRLEGTQR